jgi:hypothetical protein
LKSLRRFHDSNVRRFSLCVKYIIALVNQQRLPRRNSIESGAGFPVNTSHPMGSLCRTGVPKPSVHRGSRGTPRRGTWWCWHLVRVSRGAPEEGSDPTLCTSPPHPTTIRQPGLGLRYCTVSVTVPVAVVEPDVPVTVTV